MKDLLNDIWGHSKSTFVEGGWVIEKRAKTNRRRVGPSMCVRSLFFKKLLHCPLFSLGIFGKNGYLFIGYR